MTHDAWAREFEARVRARWTDAELRRVTGGKDLSVLPTTAPTLLRVLGLLHRDASMPPRQVRKLLQLNHMLRLLGPPLRELSARFHELVIVDAGCGLSYLTLALAWTLEHVQRQPATLIGIDVRTDLVASCRDNAERAGLTSRLRFEPTSIDAFEPPQPLHAVISLHACDTATDDAIALGLRSGAELIAVAPCCQAELSRRWTDPDADAAALRPLFETPHLRREAAATITDTMRMVLLRAAGYEVRVVEFVPSQHTAKNTLIRAMRREGGRSADALDAYRALRSTFGGAGIVLERALGIDD